MNHLDMQALRGFVALITTITLSFILTGLAVTASASGVRARLNVSATEDSWVAAHRARACISTALLYLAQDSSYPESGVSSKRIEISPGAYCKITAVERHGTQVRIKATGAVGASVHLAQVWVRLSPSAPPEIELWETL